MANTVTRVIEIDARTTDAVAALRQLQQEAKAAAEATRAAGTAGKGAGADATEGAKGFSFFANQTNAAKREYLVLAHELSQGNFTRFGGSLLVLGERLDIMGALFSATGLAVLGFSAILIGATAVFVAAAEASDKFNKTLTLTGNAAGLTATGLAQVTVAVAQATGDTQGNVKELAIALANTGEVGVKSFTSILTAEAKYQQLTGDTAAEVASKFKGLYDNPLAGAYDLDKQTHFLNATLVDQITNLVKLGDKEAAAVVVADSFTAAIRDRQAPALSLVGRFLQLFHQGLDGYKNDVNGVVAQADGLGKVTALYAQLAEVTSEIANVKGGASTAIKAQLQVQSDSIKAQIADQIKLNSLNGDDQSAALVNASHTRTQKLATEAEKRELTEDDEVKGHARYLRQIQALDKENAAIVAGKQLTDPTYNADDDSEFQARNARLRAKILKDNTTPEDKATENAYKETYDSLTKENAVLAETYDEYLKYGKAVDQSTEAKIRARIENSKDPLSKLSPPKQQDLLNLAQNQDVQRGLDSAVEAHKTVQQRIDDLNAQNAAESQNSREQAVAAALGEQARSKIVGYYDDTTAAYQKDSLALEAAVNKEKDLQLARTLLAGDLASNEEIKNLQLETSLIGANALEREKAANATKLQAEANKLIEQNPGSAGLIQADADKRINATNDAITANYNALRQFSAGAKNAFQAYIDDAENAAKFSNDFISGSLTQIEDVFVNFAKTGKLSFTDLFSFMAEEFLRESVKINLANVIKGNEGGISSVLNNIFGAIGGNSSHGAADTSVNDAETAKFLRQQAATDQANTELDAAFSLTSNSASSSSASIDLMAESAYAASQALNQVAASGAGSGLSGAAEGAVDGFDDFRTGGIMSALGKLPLQAYRSGGVARKPQIALYGEGAQNEAYVPLPDGNRIPVALQGSGTGSGGPMNVVIENHNSSDVQVKRQKGSDGKDELRIFVRAAKDNILQDIYGGGEVDKAMSNKYGISRAAGTPRRGGFN